MEKVGDFITLHPEEFLGVIDGLYFSALVSKAFPLLFIPLALFVLGLSLFIWVYRLEKDNVLQDFFLWLIAASLILYSIFRTTTTTVVLNPVVLVDPEAVLSLTERKEVKYDQNTGTYQYHIKTSGISALLAIPDKIASVIFELLNEDLIRKLAGDVNTVPLNNMTCKDPRFIANLAHNLVVPAVMNIHKETQVEDFKKRVNAFKDCYEKNWSGRSISFNLDIGEVVRNAIAGGAAGAVSGSTFLGIGAVPGAVAGGFLAGIGTAVSSISVSSCSSFKEAYEKIIDNVIAKCQNEFKAYPPNYKAQWLKGAALACVNGEISTEKDNCGAMKQRILSVLEQAASIDFNKEMTGGSTIKNFLSKIYATFSADFYSATYFSFTLKLNSLAKAQGVALALILGVFPFLALFSIIPGERRFINWPFLLNIGIAYFLVKLWIPAIYFVINIANHIFATFSLSFGS